MTNNYSSVSELKPERLKRSPIGFDELNWLYGYSKWPQGDVWGIPQYKISLWSGQSGTGKSRVAISAAKFFASIGQKVLYFQNEVDLNTFSGWIPDRKNCENFFCSNETSIMEQIKIIGEIKPSLVIVDSVNEIEEYRSGTKKDIQNIINLYRKVTIGKIVNHVIFLAQLNQDGTVKGSTTLPHLVDISMDLKPIMDNGSLFTMSIGLKHRYGRKGKEFITMWRHLDTGVECISNNRLKDEVWCLSNNVPIQKEYVDPMVEWATNVMIARENGVPERNIPKSPYQIEEDKKNKFSFKKFIFGE